MNADRWRRVEELFHAAARLAPAERGRLLDESCGDDAALRAEVESLLGYETASDGFIETPASDVAARIMAGDLTAATVSLTGMTIGHFRILDQLGEGGMGVVYEAEDTRLGRKVALKFLPSSVAATPAAIERFEREARAASALNHPHICTIYSVQDHAGRPFIEMERLEGETLRERVARGKLPIPELVALSVQVCDALGAAHAGGIVHRDLTPGNVFCTPRGAKILDFGIAKLASAPDDSGAIVGTAGYMSPEQASGQPVDARTDLFSLGAVIYEMATGQAPFQGASNAAIRQAIINAEPVPPRRLDAAIPAALERIILKALQKSQSNRYQSAGELRDRLQPLAHRGTGRRRVAAAAAAVVLIALAGAVAYWYAPLADRDLFSTNLRLRQLTRNTNEFSVRGGSISPDGRFVVYTDIRGLHLITMDTGHTRRMAMPEGVAEGALWDLQPGWLPDGSGFLVNLLAGSETTADSIWTAGLSGPPRKLRDAAWAVAVSPDGAIAFATARDRAGDRDLWIMKPDGTGARKLFDAAPGTAMRGVSFSPDSRRLSFIRAAVAGTGESIETRAIDGGSPTTVFTPANQEVLQGVLWLRDGRMLYSVTEPARGTSAGVVPCSHWQLRLDNDGRPAGAATGLADWLPQCVAAASFTADGRRFLYLQAALQDAIHIAELGVDGEPAAASKRLTFSEGRNIPSGWTADGASLVFISDSAGRMTLVRQRLDGDTADRIADEPGIVGAARLTPDGSAVIYLVAPARGSPGAQRLMRVPVTGGSPREVVRGIFVDGGARCTTTAAALCAFAERSADGRQLIFTAIDEGRGRGRELARFDAEARADYRWALSPDGTRIAVLNARTPNVTILSLRGDPAQQFAVSGASTLGYVSWTADGQRLIVPSLGPRSALLLAVDLMGQSRIVSEHPGALDVSGIPSPDGRRVAVWVRSRNAGLWLAESQ